MGRRQIDIWVFERRCMWGFPGQWRGSATELSARAVKFKAAILRLSGELFVRCRGVGAGRMRHIGRSFTLGDISNRFTFKTCGG